MNRGEIESEQKLVLSFLKSFKFLQHNIAGLLKKQFRSLNIMKAKRKIEKVKLILIFS